MSNKNKIEDKLAQANDANAIRLRNKFRQKRLLKLIDKYSVEDVALAAGFKVSTLNQYVRIANPTNISEQSVRQAEEILRDIDSE